VGVILGSLKINDLNVYIDGKEILHNINLEIQNGEFLSLLGPSGCGKTTLLKTIAGLLQAETGSIFLNDTRIDCFPPHKRGIIMVFQDLRLFPHLSVKDNIAFPLKMAGVNKKLRYAQVEAMLEMVKLPSFAERQITQLSGGQQQRVALARALIAKPKALLLDEPFSSFDEDLRADMNNLVHDLQQQLKTTTLLVTHDKNEAKKLSDRIAVMSNGSIKRELLR
jgi:putative spermidine/putrescine transport system ATP-binding protein